MGDLPNLDRAGELRALYEQLRVKFVAADGSAAAALHLRMTKTLEELDSLAGPRAGSGIDELAGRRAVFKAANPRKKAPRKVAKGNRSHGPRK